MNILALCAVFALGSGPQEADPENRAPETPSRFGSDNVGYGPFNQISLAALTSLRPGFRPRMPSALPRGCFEAQLTETWVNLWAEESPDGILDYEILRSHVALAYAISDAFVLTADFEQESRFGGTLDPLIDAAHRVSDMRHSGRESFPRNEFHFELPARDGHPAVVLDNGDRGSFAQAVVLSLQYEFREDPTFCWGGSLRKDLGDGDDIEESGAIDGAIFGSVSQRMGPFYGYLGASFAWFGKDEFRGVALSPTQISALIAIEWRWFDRFSFVIQHLVSEGVLENDGPLSNPSHEVAAGWKWEVRPGTLLELGIIENISSPHNSPDFGFHAGLAVRW